MLIYSQLNAAETRRSVPPLTLPVVVEGLKVNTELTVPRSRSYWPFVAAFWASITTGTLFRPRVTLSRNY